MDKPAAKRAKRAMLSTEEVLLELEEDGDEPVTAGSDDEFEDMICEERERDEWEGDDIFSTNIPSTSYACSNTPHSLLVEQTARSSHSLSAGPFVSSSHSVSGGPFASPSHSLTGGPFVSPSHSLTGGPLVSPSHSLTGGPLVSPSHSLTGGPLVSPSHSLTGGPLVSPSHSLTGGPLVSPSHSLTGGPLVSPSHSLTGGPLVSPSHSLTGGPLVSPSHSLTGGPLVSPSHSLSVGPFVSPSYSVSGGPLASPFDSECVGSSHSLSAGPSLLAGVQRVPATPQHSRAGEHSAMPEPEVSTPDPLSLPLSSYFSLPLSNLVQVLNEALSVHPTASTVSNSVTSAPSTSNPGPQLSGNGAVPTTTSGSSAGSTTRQPPQRAPQRSAQRNHAAHVSSTPLGNWSSNLEPNDVAPFVQAVGPTVVIPHAPVDTFKLFFTDDLCSYIVGQTNLYAQQVMGTDFPSWERVTEEELRAYFGFQILMGLVDEPATEDYWRRDELHYSPIADRISRKRFRDIHRFLHFVDNTTLTPRGQAGYDRLGKVRPVMEKVQNKIYELYKPNRENAMDEAMIKCDGRNRLKQYMPAKPVKRGIKVWCRADSHNGYLCEFQVYTGRDDRAEGGLGKRVVLDLSQRLEGKHHHVYFDNFFTSVDLLHTLRERGTYACGTVRQTSRGFPPALKVNGKGKRELERHGLYQRGDSRILQNNGMTAILWRDNRVVTLLSTNTQPQNYSTVQRRQHDGTRRSVPCPEAMELYNKYMGGVDRNDQLRQYYHVRLKSRKFYRYIFWFLFEVCLANSYILHKHFSGGAKLTLKEFRLEVARGLIGDYNSRKRAGRSSMTPTVLPIRHFPVKHLQGEKTIRVRCALCGKQSQWWCRDCKVHLCHTGVPATDCFMKHHC